MPRVLRWRRACRPTWAMPQREARQRKKRRIEKKGDRESVSSPREKHPHRHLEPRFEAVAADIRVAAGVRDEVIRAAMPRRHLDPDQGPIDARFLAGFAFALRDRDL